MSDIEKKLLEKLEEFRNNMNIIDEHLFYLEDLDKESNCDDVLSKIIPSYQDLTDNIDWSSVFIDMNKYPANISIQLIKYLNSEFDEIFRFHGEYAEYSKETYSPERLLFIVHKVVIPILKLIWNNDLTERSELNDKNPLK